MQVKPFELAPPFKSFRLVGSSYAHEAMKALFAHMAAGDRMLGDKGEVANTSYAADVHKRAK